MLVEGIGAILSYENWPKKDSKLPYFAYDGIPNTLPRWR